VNTVGSRKEELLADRALVGLTDEEARELEQLGASGDDSFDVAAARIALAELVRTGDRQDLPDALSAKVLARAPSTLAGTERGRPYRPRWDRGRGMGWLAAVAAAAVAIFGWLRPPTVVEKVKVVEVQAPRPPEPSPTERRAELLSAASDVRTVDWSATPDPAASGATGDVVWSQSRQQGYMRIRGLAPNEPRVAQYQLWIFDGKREQAHPVDGGVFDVVDGEVVVPIRAAVAVFEPKLFAVTVERPGGVVVSKRERIVLTAAL